MTNISAIANQESLSALETEMRKLEGLVKEIVDEMSYLRKREERFTNTNGADRLYPSIELPFTDVCAQSRRGTVCNPLRYSRYLLWFHWAFGRSSICVHSSNVNISLIDVLKILLLHSTTKHSI